MPVYEDIKKNKISTFLGILSWNCSSNDGDGFGSKAKSLAF